MRKCYIFHPVLFVIPTKEKSEKVCVVEDIGDLWAIEKSKAYDGHYHVLGGVLSAIDGIGPDELSISSLMKKVQSKK